MKKLALAAVALAFIGSGKSAHAITWGRVSTTLRALTNQAAIGVSDNFVNTSALWIVANQSYNADGNQLYRALGAPLLQPQPFGAMQISSPEQNYPWIITASGGVKRWDTARQTFVVPFNSNGICATSIAARDSQTAYIIGCGTPVDAFNDRSILYYNGGSWVPVASGAGRLISVDRMNKPWVLTGLGTVNWAQGSQTNLTWNLAGPFFDIALNPGPFSAWFATGGKYDGSSGGAATDDSAYAISTAGTLFVWASTYWQYIGDPPQPGTGPVLQQISRKTNAYGLIGVDTDGVIWEGI